MLRCSVLSGRSGAVSQHLRIQRAGSEKNVSSKPFTPNELFSPVAASLEGRGVQTALRYALAPGCILLAVLVYMSPLGPTFSLPGLFVFAVLAAAWFGGAGPGFAAAVLATFAVPHLIAVGHPLLAGVLDVPRFITFSIEGLAVGWWSFRRRQVDAALRESEKRYELAMNASDEGFWDWVVAGDKLYVSPRFVELLGFPAGTTFAGRAAMLQHLSIPDEDRAALEHAIAEHFAGNTARMEMEFRILAHGEVRWIHAVGRATRDSHGQVVRWNGAIRDVTASRRAEAALRESEERYALAMEAAGDGHTDWNLETGEHYISPRLLKICGYAPGTTFRDRAEWVRRFPFHPEDRPKWEKAIAAHFAGPESNFKMELRIVVRGDVRWTAFHFLSKRDAAGKPIRWTGSIGDITEQKRAEEGLRASEERYSLALEAAEEGYVDSDIDTDEFVTSERLNEIFGIPRGTRFVDRTEFLKHFQFYGDDATIYGDMIRAVGTPGGPDRYEFEFRIIQPSGEVRWLWTRGRVTRDAEGRARRRIGVVADITARKLAEEALRESEQRYELAMAASESGYWDWHIPTNRYFLSPRAFELGGYPPGTKWIDRDEYKLHINMHPEDFARWETARQELFAGTGERLAMEVRYIVRGETRWHMLQGICRRDDAGKVIRWTGSATDITERKLAEEGLKTMERKLRQAQRLEAMGTLAGGIAHDFNNILGAILGYSEMALRDAPKGSRLARDLDSIMVAGERGRALVDRVLAFSRSAVGEVVPVHVERIVREVLDQVSAKLPSNVTVQANLHAGSAAILGDATQVHQVVTNLATNAIQAMPAGGTLRVELGTEHADAPRAATIGACRAGEYVVLTVADAGVGIAPEIVDRIFDPFFTTKEVGTGTGLGLSLVHGIVTDLGGAIDVASTPASGSTFTVYLPRSGDAPEASADSESQLPRGEGQRVLIVDDEEPLVELATRTLTELGYVPIGFTSSLAALAAFRADPQRFDAVITDERMPEMSGSTLIREVRAVRSSIAVVVMSGYLGATARKSAGGDLADTLSAGPELATSIDADAILQKPLSARDLAASLARVLRV
jgi:PAS domain S-box-containing protein